MNKKRSNKKKNEWEIERETKKIVIEKMKRQKLAYMRAI